MTRRPRSASTTPAVLFVSVPTGVGGSTRSLATVLAHLHGDAVRILAAPRAGRFVGLVSDMGAIEEHLPVISSRPPRQLRRVGSAVRLAVYAFRHRHRLTAIHANGLKELSLCAVAARVSGVPLVVWVHNFKLPPSVRLLGWWWRRLLPRCDVRWAAVSPLARDLVVDAGLTSADAVAIVPNPIDPVDLLADHQPSSDHRVRVAFLGSPRAYKGFDLLPDIIAATGPPLPVQWLVFSHQVDDHLAETWARLRKMATAGLVDIEGKFTDVRMAYARCDIVVCPSILDSFCRVAAEAMLNGIPVVASDLEPIRALLGADEAGLLFRPGDVLAAADAVARLVHDPDLRGRLGAAGRERVAAYSTDRVRQQLRELYGLQPKPVATG